MPSSKILYPKSGVTEIDLRKEVRDMFFGTSTEIPKSHKVLLRRMRRNSDGSLIEAPSVDPLTKEADADSYDPYSLGENYIWDEEFISCRKWNFSTDTSFSSRQKYLEGGMLNVQSVVFFVEYTVNPTYDDRIVEVELDAEGNVVLPVNRISVWRPQTIVDHRSDRGRIEYYAVYVTEMNKVKIK